MASKCIQFNNFVSGTGTGYRYTSFTDLPSPDLSAQPLESNVLRKVASLTFEKATMDKKSHKSKFIPEKINFQNYEKFEGMYMKLMNYVVGHY